MATPKLSLIIPHRKTPLFYIESLTYERVVIREIEEEYTSFILSKYKTSIDLIPHQNSNSEDDLQEPLIIKGCKILSVRMKDTEGKLKLIVDDGGGITSYSQGDVVNTSTSNHGYNDNGELR